MFKQRFTPFFNADDGAGGAGEPTDPKPNDPAPQDPPKPTEQTIPYERFAKVNDRAKSLETSLKSYEQYGSPDDLAAKLAKLDELEKAQLSAAERDKLEREELTKKAADLEKKALDTEARANQIRVEAEFKLLAKDAVNPNAALKLADLSKISIDGDKVVGLEEALAALKESDPYLFAQPKPAPKPIGGESNPGEHEKVDTLEAQLEDAKKRGSFTDVVRISNQIAALKNSKK